LIRTLRQMLGRWRAADPEGGADWPSVLDDFRKNYNRTQHSTIKQRPIDVWKGKAKNLQKVVWIANKLSIGDYVRVLLRNEKSAFSKADDLKWSTDVYQILEPDGSRWKLKAKDNGPEPPDGSYMEYELLLVDPQSFERTGGHFRAPAKANAAVARRLKKEDIGEVSEDIGGRPIFSQLIVSAPRNRRPVQRYSPK